MVFDSISIRVLKKYLETESDGPSGAEQKKVFERKIAGKLIAE